MGRFRPRRRLHYRRVSFIRWPSTVGSSPSLDSPKRSCRRTERASFPNRDMMWNDSCPNIRVDPQTFDVYVDGELATCEPARELPLAQRYMLR